MDIDKLKNIASQVLSRTILAADESTATIKKRLSAIGIESTPEINRQYRQLLFTAPGIEKYVSGIIMFDETIRQSTDDGTPFPTFLEKKGIVPGIKVDKGTGSFSSEGADTYTQGLDGLAERLAEYKKLGAKFAKWRAVYMIESNYPTDEVIDRNAEDLASYASICQQAGIVPIVEPEVLMDGNNSAEADKDVTLKVLTAVFKQLYSQNIAIKGIILKPNMITAGKSNPQQISVEEVAQTTLAVLKEIVPVEVPGIAFLSGGQSPELATLHLNAINHIKAVNATEYSWRLTASYGRALQSEALETWAGKPENIAKAQEVFISRAAKVYQASLGQL